jgi:YesN/AraC family two-component response regulator
MENFNTRVLLVYDHIIVRQGIEALLDTQEGIEVVGEAEDGREAIERRRNKWFQV